jgi:pimeloyl-ACP methyl ester carboxylesterase
MRDDGMPARPVRLDQTLMHDGHRLVYDELGGDGPVLVYLHGLLLDSQMNQEVAVALAAHGNRVVLLDLLGHGRSDKPTHASEYRIDSYADQVIALLDHLGLDHVALGGISLGANVSLFTASHAPGRVHGLVLEMPVLENAVPPAALMFTSMLLAAHYARPLVHATSSVIRRVPRTRFGPLNSILDAGSLEPETIAAVLHGVLVGPVAPTKEQRRAITTPTLVLAHRRDLIHPFDDAVGLVGQLPNATLVRARSPLELRLAPARLTEEIVTFLGRLDSDIARRRRRPAMPSARSS